MNINFIYRNTPIIVVVDIVISIINDWMAKLNISIAQAAERSNINEKTFRKVLNKQNLTALIYLLRIINALEIPVLEFILEFLCRLERTRNKTLEREDRLQAYYEELEKAKEKARKESDKNKLDKLTISTPFDRSMRRYVDMLNGVFCFLQRAYSVEWTNVTEKDVSELKEILENCLTSLEM